MVILASNKEVCDIQLARPARDCNSLENKMRIEINEQSIFECSWFCFVAVDAEISQTLAIFWRKERPLQSCGKTSTAAPSKNRILDSCDNLRGFHIERLFEGFISIGLHELVVSDDVPSLWISMRK